MKENRIVFKHSPNSPEVGRSEKPEGGPVAKNFIDARLGAGPGAELLVAQAGPEKQKVAVESAEKKPVLAEDLQAGYESLPIKAFMGRVKPKWEAIAAKLTPEILSKINKLENPRIYGVNAEGELLIGDGGRHVPTFTLGQDLFQVRNVAKLAGLGLMTEAEYVAFNRGDMEGAKTSTWLQSSEGVRGTYGFLAGSSPYVAEGNPGFRDALRGARRVLRVSGF